MSKTIRRGRTNREMSADISFADPNATVALIEEHGCESAHPSNQQPTDSHEETIRSLAHSKWEAAGCPAGDGVEFWLEAEREVDTERAGASTAQE